MFESLAVFCKRQTKGSHLSITTLYYMEKISDLNGATIGQLVIESKDRGNINKMLVSHDDWFEFLEPKGEKIRGRPGRRIYLSKRGRCVLNAAKKAYIKGFNDEKSHCDNP